MSGPVVLGIPFWDFDDKDESMRTRCCPAEGCDFTVRMTTTKLPAAAHKHWTTAHPDLQHLNLYSKSDNETGEQR